MTNRELLLSMIVLLTAFAVGVGRLYVPGHSLSLAGTYEAFAHIWVGVAASVAIGCWRSPVGKAAAACLAVATVLETVMFLTRA